MDKLNAKKKLKSDNLLNTAFELFTSKGISKTSIADIVNKAGVAKGTFYLYFKDKYDLRNKLISHKSSQLFESASAALAKSGITDFDESFIFLIDHIIDDLDKNHSLLNFISKNLSWGIFKNALITPSEDSVDFYNVYIQLLKSSPYKFREPELMIFMIVELVSSTCYSTILYNEPVSITELKPYLNEAVLRIINMYKV